MVLHSRSDTPPSCFSVTRRFRYSQMLKFYFVLAGEFLSKMFSSDGGVSVKGVFAIQSYTLDHPFRLWTPFMSDDGDRKHTRCHYKWILSRLLLFFYWIWCFIVLIFMALKAGESILFREEGLAVSPIVR